MRLSYFWEGIEYLDNFPKRQPKKVNIEKIVALVICNIKCTIGL